MKIRKQPETMHDALLVVYCLTMENRALRRALKPFAKFAKEWARTPQRGLDPESIYGFRNDPNKPDGGGATLLLSDCRRAWKALERDYRKAASPSSTVSRTRSRKALESR